MENIVNCNFKIDKLTKNAFDSLCDNLGITMSAAINMFIKEANRSQSIPVLLRLNVNDKSKEEIVEQIINTYRIRNNASTLYSDEELTKIWEQYKKENRIKRKI